MNTTITRRTALAAILAAPVTLPLLPVSAFATPADPAVEAYKVWHAAFVAWERSFERPDLQDDDPTMLAAMSAEWRAKVDLASMVATTPEGLAGQVRMGLNVFGQPLNQPHPGIARENRPRRMHPPAIPRL
jgi:hypothetical protein